MEFYPDKSLYNTDVECMYDKKYSASKSLFKDSKHNSWFTEYWQKTCLNKTECEMDPSYMTTTDDYNMDYDDFDQGLDVAPKLSDNCIQRMRYRNTTS